MGSVIGEELASDLDNGDLLRLLAGVEGDGIACLQSWPKIVFALPFKLPQDDLW